MSPPRLIKHNPAFLTSSELEEAFVVRQRELGTLTRILRDNCDSTSVQHILVIGRRGMGKTMLVRRLALEVLRIDELNDRWVSVVLPEDVYNIASEGEFWLQALSTIADQNESQQRWTDLHEAVRQERDEQRLRARALAALREYSETAGKRLLVIVENMQTLVGEQSWAEEGWNLRHTLMNQEFIMLVATATTRFDEIEHSDRANYELFRELELTPLDTDECRVLWKGVSGEDLSKRRIRPMEILTGGSPRLLAIVADFAAGRSIGALMEELVVLIDDHTTYFKANVEILPPRERRVFVTLAELWQPAEAREVADFARMDVNKTSALLKKLMNRGAVEQVEKIGRKYRYQIVERLYNIYYLMRLSGGKARRVEAFVRLLVPIYGEERVAGAAMDRSRLSEAIEWARRATESLPESKEFQHTFASLLAIDGRWSDAFVLVRSFLDDSAFLAAHTADIVDFFCLAAASGKAADALEQLRGSLAEKEMEALVAALKMEAGLPVRAPREVVEVAKDLRIKFERRRKDL